MFQPGQSGNPGGKSKIQVEFEKKCRDFMSEKGWELIKNMALSQDKKARAWALEQILNRGFGKPKETLNVTTGDESPLSPIEIEAGINELIAGQVTPSLPAPGSGEVHS